MLEHYYIQMNVIIHILFHLVCNKVGQVYNKDATLKVLFILCILMCIV
jgi:hypothetical protein